MMQEEMIVTNLNFEKWQGVWCHGCSIQNNSSVKKIVEKIRIFQLFSTKMLPHWTIWWLPTHLDSLLQKRMTQKVLCSAPLPLWLIVRHVTTARSCEVKWTLFCFASQLDEITLESFYCRCCESYSREVGTSLCIWSSERFLKVLLEMQKLQILMHISCCYFLFSTLSSSSQHSP